MNYTTIRFEYKKKKRERETRIDSQNWKIRRHESPSCQ
jgi:hypothetical protein